ncbi:MAG TPA: asparagine synthase-related protein [Steroidobacteraceae bacterium]|nr:asparagine synthase-related protein [Steroidobacteraceae bacterium]
MNAKLLVPVRRLDISIPADNEPPAGGPNLDSGPPRETVQLVCANRAWRADISLRSASERSLVSEAAASGCLLSAVGDADEARAMPAAAPCANACLIRLDLANSTVRVSTSLTGLPPLFLFRRGAQTTLSCPFLPDTLHGSLEPDLEGIADTLRWGHPLDGRTHWIGLRFAPSFSTVTVAPDGTVSVGPTAAWPDLRELASLAPAEIVRAQVAAFTDAAARIRPDNAFMSLSGGLDSRTSLVALLSHGHRIPCVTMGGSPENLDVQLAQAFCRAHGLDHHTVLLGEEFQRRAPQLLLRSAALTGGVSSLSQMADLFLYESMRAPYGARVSGNFGNQVGRGGVESLSAYDPRPDVFSPALRERLLNRPAAPWFIPRLTGGNHGEILFGQEAHFWSIANYVAGSSHATQLTPYADFRLMQLARAAFARNRKLVHARWETLRGRDLRHRLAGTPKALSFQRQFLMQHDRRAAHIPLNWGWRAAGGWSVGWGLTAVAGAADAALIKLGARSPLLRTTALWGSSRLGHRSTLVDWRQLLKTRLRELTMDTFATQHIRESGVFDPGALDRVLTEHFSGAADSQYTVARALEIALGISVRR